MAATAAAAAAAVEFLQQLLKLGAPGRVRGRRIGRRVAQAQAALDQRTRLCLVRRPEFGQHGREQIEGDQIAVTAKELRAMSDERIIRVKKAFKHCFRIVLDIWRIYRLILVPTFALVFR